MTATMRGPVLSLVAARGKNGVIGRDGDLPWRLKSDMARFKAITGGKPILMGRRTWDSLPFRPLPGRLNLVLSRDMQFEAEGGVVCETLQEAIEIAREQAADDGVDEICVIGGAGVYAATLPLANRLHLTEVEASPPGDVVFPSFNEADWREVERTPVAAGPGDDHDYVYRRLERIGRP